MIQLSQLMEELNRVSPFELQEGWDNSGLLIGHAERKVTTAVVALEADEKVIDEAPAGSVIITHHPLMFGKLNRLDFATYPANLIEKMIKKELSHIALHTNFDKTHLNRYVAESILGFNIEEGEDFILYFDVNATFEEFSAEVAKKLGLEQLKTVTGERFIKRAALTTGSGASLLSSVDADCFLTADIKYHDAMEAKSLNLALIDIGHYESEHHFTEVLSQNLNNLQLSVIIANSKNPFQYLHY